MHSLPLNLHTHTRGFRAMFVRAIGVFLTLAFVGLALADPPLRVARLGYLSGAVSFSPAGENDWVTGVLNRPLVTGDRLWADNRGRAELQIGTAVIRLGTSTLFTLTNLDDRIAQMHLQDGTLNVRVRRLDRNQVVEIDTPNLAFVIRQAGEYRITVNARTDSTEVRTRSGRAEVFGTGAHYAVTSGRAYRFFGAGLADYDVLVMPAVDEFDRWAQTRDRGYDSSISARYVSRDVIGYQDLDPYGRWSTVPEYGNVWMPTRVAANWAPYRDGHWSWVEPWGWTWVDDQPWGFTVSHYGRWANTSDGWGWIPGPISARPVYAPALVAFIGGSNFQVAVSGGNVGAVGWFPLGPREIYRPAYAVSRDYFTSVNTSNTVINNTTIINNYDNRNATTVGNAVYVNRNVPGAVVTVPTVAFVRSQPVAPAALRVSEAAITAAPVHTIAAVAPTQVSVLGAAPVSSKPPQMAERRVVAQSQPPAAAVGFAVRERALAVNPGKPVETAALAAMKPTAPAPTATPATPSVAVPAPRVEIVPPARAVGAAGVAPPPQAASVRRGKDEQPLPRRELPPATQQQAQPQPAPAPAKPAPAQRAPDAIPAPQPPAAPRNLPRGEREVPGVTPPVQVAPPSPERVPPRAVPPQQPAVTAPAAAPMERAPVEPQRGRVAAPEQAPPKPAPAAQPPQLPAQPPQLPAAPPQPAAAPPQAPAAPPHPAPARPPESVNVGNPPAKSEGGDKKPRVVEEKKGDKHPDKKDDKDDEEKQRK